MSGKSTKHLSPDTRTIPAALAHHISHGMGDHATGHAVRGNLARDGAPKRLTAVGVHSGMHTKTKDGITRTGGSGMASALESGSVGPGLGDFLACPPKVFPDTKPVIGQRSRTANGGEYQAPGVGVYARMRQGNLNHELGRAILRSAVVSGATALPQTVDED